MGQLPSPSNTSLTDPLALFFYCGSSAQRKPHTREKETAPSWAKVPVGSYLEASHIHQGDSSEQQPRPGNYKTPATEGSWFPACCGDFVVSISIQKLDELRVESEKKKRMKSEGWMGRFGLSHL